MFIYEKGNSLNLTFEGSIPVENPDVVIKGYEDGATLTVNDTIFGSGSKEFEGKANTLVYQKDNKLVITFRGVAGMNEPDVTIDDLGNSSYEVVVSGVSTILTIVDNRVEISTEETHIEEPVVESEKPSEPEIIEEEPEEVVEE